MQAINLCFSNVLHFQKISHLFQITRLVILVIIGLFDISFSQIKRQTIYYYRHKSMVSKVTIAIDEMVTAQPLGPMVFIGPRCPWGPIYGSGSLSLTEYERFCRLN